MLFRQDGSAFSVGRSRFEDREEVATGGTAAKIFVKIAPEALGGVLLLAELDTGAAWSVLHTEVAEALDLLNGTGEPVPYSTRLGRITGHLERTSIYIIADEGESLRIEATVWVSREWPGGNFLGYGGLLERIRFAIDPGDNFFYFGPLL
jgi:hypothetical protein